jgi:hypothetical protein
MDIHCSRVRAAFSGVWHHREQYENKTIINRVCDFFLMVLPPWGLKNKSINLFTFISKD